jgi:hypothetical protein
MTWVPITLSDCGYSAVSAHDLLARAAAQQTSQQHNGIVFPAPG